MPHLKNKPRKTIAWLPNQVLYGLDVSDQDPTKWQPFGEQHEQDVAKQAAQKSQTSAKSGQLAQSAPGAQ